MKGMPQTDLAGASDPLLTPELSDLFFDDAPYRGPDHRNDQPSAGTPSSAVRLWNDGVDQSIDCARAVVAIIAHSPSLITTLKDPEKLEASVREALRSECSQDREDALAAANKTLGLAALSATRGDHEGATQLSNEAIGLCLDHQIADEIQLAPILAQLIAILKENGGHRHAKRLERVFERKRMLTNLETASVWQLRHFALELVLEGDYSMAEKAYSKLVDRNHELASTYCHLARLHLMANQLAKAAADVQNAWENRKGAEPYMVVRTLYLQILLAMVGGRRFNRKLQHLKKLISAGSAHHHWTFEPMLAAVKSRLPSTNFPFMTVLGQALGSRKRMAALEKTRLWQPADPKRRPD